RDAGGPSVARQVLCYPVLDFDQDTESYRRHDGVFHSIAPGGWTRSVYLAGQEITPYAAPLRATDLSGLPPALVIAAERDPLRDALRDDAHSYATRLDEAAYVEYAGTMHAFLNFCGALGAGDHAIGVIGAYLRQAFDSETQDAAAFGSETPAAA